MTEAPYTRAEDGLKNKERAMSGFRRVETEHDFGRGRVTIIQVIPKGLTAKAQKEARKQIFFPGINPFGDDGCDKLEGDLYTLAENSQSQAAEPLVIVGIAFTGKRKNSPRLVSGFPQGVDVTQLTLEKAKDFVDATNELIDGKNAEVVGFSLGGSIALIAAYLGLKVDTIGLFSSTGLLKDGKNYIGRHRVEKPLKTDQDGQRSFWDKVKRSAAEYASARRSTRLLIDKLPEDIQIIIGNSEGDRFAPRREALGEKPREIKFVDLPWRGHTLGSRKNPEKRGSRLSKIGRIMRETREKSLMEKARKFHVLAEQAREKMQPLEALELIDQAISVCKAAGNKPLHAELLSSKSITYRHLYQSTRDREYLEKARDTSESAVEIAKESGDQTALAVPLFQLANVLEALGELPDAVATYRDAVDNIVNNPPVTHNRPAVVADFKVHLATCEYKAGDKTALTRAEAALQELEAAEEPDTYAQDVWVSGALLRLADILREDYPTKARASLQRAKTIIDANPLLIKRREQWEELAVTFQ